MKNLTFLVVIVSIVLVACAPVAISTPTAIPTKTPTPTYTPLPTNTLTPIPSITPIPTPIGAGVLKVASVASCADTSSDCLMIGDFFSGKVDFKIPLHDDPNRFLTDSPVKWSPDGSYLFYQDRTKKQLEIYIFDVDTQQSKIINTHPAKAGRTDNSVLYISWSNDSKNILYTTSDANNKGKVFIGNIDGTVKELDGYYDTWLPDNQTVISFGSGAYNIETAKKTRGTGNYSIWAIGYSQNFIVGRSPAGDQLQLIRFPQSFSDLEQSTPSQSIFATFEPKLQLYNNGPIQLLEISDNYVLLGGIVDVLDKGKSTNTIKALHKFSKIIDLRKLPVIITINDITDEYPIILSPDKSVYLSSFCIAEIPDLPCKVYDPDWWKRESRFMSYKLWNIQNVESPSEMLSIDDLIQFKSSMIQQIEGQVIEPFNLGGQNTLQRMGFYWEP